MDQELVHCCTCETSQHAICMGPNKDMKPYKCPLCLISNLDPFTPVNLNNPQAVALFPFRIGRYTSADSLENLCNDNELAFEIPRCTKQEKLYLRSIKLDGSSTQHIWPSTGRLVINSNVTIVFKSAKSKYMEKPFCLPDNLPKLNFIMLLHDVTESQADDNTNIFVAAIVLASKISPRKLFQKTLSQVKLTLTESRELFLKKLRIANKSVSENDDAICQDSSIRLPLTNVYNTTKMVKIPCYGPLCQHLQSFDLFTYIQQNEHLGDWKCPICKQLVYEPIIDVYTHSLLIILKSFKLKAGYVFVDEDGNFRSNNDLQIVFSEKHLQVMPSTLAKEQGNEENALNIASINQQELAISERQSQTSKEGRTPSPDKNPKQNIFSVNIQSLSLNPGILKNNLANLARISHTIRKKKIKKRCIIRLNTKKTNAVDPQNWVPFANFCETAQTKNAITESLNSVQLFQPLFKNSMKFI